MSPETRGLGRENMLSFEPTHRPTQAREAWVGYRPFSKESLLLLHIRLRLRRCRCRRCWALCRWRHNSLGEKDCADGKVS